MENDGPRNPPDDEQLHWDSPILQTPEERAKREEQRRAAAEEKRKQREAENREAELRILARQSELFDRQTELIKEQTKIESDVARFTKIMVGLTAVSVFVAAAATVFSGIQASEASRSAGAAVTAAKATEDSVTEARLARAASEAQAVKTAEESRRALEATLKQGREAMDASTMANARTQRAYVSFEQTMMYTTLPNGKIEFGININNSGATAAQRVSHFVNAKFVNSEITRKFTFEDQIVLPPQFHVLAPKSHTTADSDAFEVPRLVAVQRGVVRLYFWGWVTYKDVFPGTKEHIAMFCTEIGDIVGNLRVAGRYAMSFEGCPFHNCMDDDCKGEPYGNPVKIWQ